MTARDEKGYVQFRCDWSPAPPPAGPLVEALAAWRNRLFALGLVGSYPDGVGYGNVSGRWGGGGFVVSGTATGGLSELRGEHFAEVQSFDCPANHVVSRGRVRPSSESLSHGAVYLAAPEAGAVIHVHSLTLWRLWLDRLPTTIREAEAGTPGMAAAIATLLAEKGARERGVFVMGGHREGLMAFGATIDEAGRRLLDLRGAELAVTGG